jgi:2-dehydro-3-deoxyglucarate aldolase
MKATIGSWLTLGHNSIVEIMADSGFDWLCIDLEHTVIDLYEAQQMILTIQSKGLKAYVRVGDNDNAIIKRVLDAGADGIIVPMVNSKKDALRAINAVKYPPIGKRGVGLARAQGYGFNFDDYKDNYANQIKLIVQIEHIEAVNNLEEILSLEHIDGTFIGPYDLSGSMGKPGKYDDNDVQLVLKKYEEISSRYNKLKGFHVIEPNYERVVDKINKGYDFIAFSLDTLFLGSIVKDQLSHLRKV